VNYRHGATKEDALEKLQYDLYYLKNMSFLLDLDILLKTVRVVLFGRGHVEKVTKKRRLILVFIILFLPLPSFAEGDEARKSDDKGGSG